MANTQNNKFLAINKWMIYIAPATWLTLPTITRWTNDELLSNYLKTNPTWYRLFQVKNVQWTYSNTENRAQVRPEDCWSTETNFALPTAKVSFNMLEIFDYTAVSLMTWIPIRQVAWTPLTWEIMTILSWFTVQTPYVVSKQNANWTAPNISSVVWSVSWAILVANYDLVKMWWLWAISFASWVNTAQDITITYDVTPASRVIFTWEWKTEQLPTFIVKIQTCPDDNSWKVNMHFLTNCSMNWELMFDFIDVWLKGWDIEWAPMEFLAWTWFKFVNDLETVI